jgi:hypothetical protein
VRPESITGIVLALIPVAVLTTASVLASVLWLGSPTSGPPVHAGSGPVVNHVVADTAAAVATVPETRPIRGGEL